MNRTHAHELYRQHHPQIMIIVEPRIVDDHAQAVIDTLPYSHSQKVDPIGYSSGIWLLWSEDSRLIVEILTTNAYSILALVKIPTNSCNFLFTAICASPDFNKRKILWNYLKDLSPFINMSWVLLGDFNDMLAKDEKRWGLALNRYWLNAFRDCIDFCGLMDLGFHGPKFT